MTKKFETRSYNFANYWPLFVLIAVSALVAFTLVRSIGNFRLTYDFDQWSVDIGPAVLMHYFMGFFLVSFAMLKLFQPSGFADGFQMYDLLAKRSRAYAYVYPYIELALGLGYLSFTAPYFIYAATILIFAFGAAGVVLALRQGLNTKCACMGTILNVPLSTVTLTEDIAMIAMAAWMLLKP